MLGFLLFVLGVLVVTPCVGLMFGALAAAGLAIGLVWLYVEHRRVRNVEERWYAEHPYAHRQRPSS